MVIFCSRLVAVSRAWTFKMPLASMSKATSICGMPRGAGGIPTRWNLPSVRLSRAMGRSPCRTWISTEVWLSEAVEKVSLLRVGMVVLRVMSVVMTPPRVSMPSESGVTSSSSKSFTSPPSTPPCTAAPTATTSSGFTPLCGSRAKSSRTTCCTRGIRVEPPTSTTSLICSGFNPASSIACRQGPSVRCTRSSINCSSLARVSFSARCLGPAWSAVTKGRLISDSWSCESSTFDFSAASFSRCKAMRSLERSMPWSRLNSSMIQSMIFWSMSSPPRWVSPLVALTSTTPSPTSRIEMSKVPPPKSYTAMTSSFLRSSP